MVAAETQVSLVEMAPCLACPSSLIIGFLSLSLPREPRTDNGPNCPLFQGAQKRNGFEAEGLWEHGSKDAQPPGISDLQTSLPAYLLCSRRSSNCPVLLGLGPHLRLCLFQLTTVTKMFPGREGDREAPRIIQRAKADSSSTRRW